MAFEIVRQTIQLQPMLGQIAQILPAVAHVLFTRQGYLVQESVPEIRQLPKDATIINIYAEGDVIESVGPEGYQLIHDHKAETFAAGIPHQIVKVEAPIAIDLNRIQADDYV